VHVSVKVVFTVGETDCVPLSGSLPDHPPDAEQAVALVEDHVRVEDRPLTIDVGPQSYGRRRVELLG
jgi:hypothetical protein